MAKSRLIKRMAKTYQHGNEKRLDAPIQNRTDQFDQTCKLLSWTCNICVIQVIPPTLVLVIPINNITFISAAIARAVNKKRVSNLNPRLGTEGYSFHTTKQPHNHEIKYH